MEVSVPYAPAALSPPINTQHPTRPQHRQSPRHTNTIPQHIQFTPPHLPPPDGHLLDPNPRTGARGPRGARRALGEHQHLDVEDPAFGVHVGDYVRQGGPREELEAALRVADA